MWKRRAYVFRFFFIMGKVIASEVKQSRDKFNKIELEKTQRRQSLTFDMF